MNHKLPELEYSYSALEPFIDKMTMEIHHTKHHAAYVDNLNKALSESPNLSEMNVVQIIKNLNEVPEGIYWQVRNNAGGHYNHSLFWSIMGNNKESAPIGELAQKINETFGDFSTFKKDFSKASLGRFGSGWAWLVADSNGTLSITTTPNQDTPIMDNLKPIIGIDLWEHAYYLKYQNRRVEYIENWWNVLNWSVAEKRFHDKNF